MRLLPSLIAYNLGVSGDGWRLAQKSDNWSVDELDSPCFGSCDQLEKQIQEQLRLVLAGAIWRVRRGTEKQRHRV